MRTRACFAARVVVFLVATCVGITPLAASAEDGETVRAFYFGNSLTAGTAPEFHDQLAKSYRYVQGWSAVGPRLDRDHQLRLGLH